MNRNDTFGIATAESAKFRVRITVILSLGNWLGLRLTWIWGKVRGQMSEGKMSCVRARARGSSLETGFLSTKKGVRGGSWT